MNEPFTIPAHAEKKSSRMAWIFLVLTCALIAGLIFFWPKISQKLNANQQESTATEELQSKVEMLERRVSELSGSIYQAQQRADEALSRLGGQASESVNSDDAQFGGLEQRIQALESRSVNTGPLPDAADMLSRLAALERKAAANPVMNGEDLGRVVQESRQSRRAMALLTSYSLLVQAVGKGTPYTAAAAQFSELAADDPALSPQAETIMLYREQGVPTLSILEKEFYDAVEKNRNRQASISGNAWQRLKTNLAGLVVIRKIGEEVAGASEDAVIARAEAKLHRGAVADAVTEVKSLPTEAQALFAQWIARGEAHVAVQDALARLQVLIWQARNAGAEESAH